MILLPFTTMEYPVHMLYFMSHYQKWSLDYWVYPANRSFLKNHITMHYHQIFFIAFISKKVIVIPYHGPSAYMWASSPPLTINFFYYHSFPLFFFMFMVLDDHSKTLQSVHLIFFCFFEKMTYHTFFFHYFILEKNGFCITIYFIFLLFYAFFMVLIKKVTPMRAFHQYF